ncbi:D-alanyl-D-alanine carboxypeptidase, partial [Streptomyces sp. NPDC051129]
PPPTDIYTPLQTLFPSPTLFRSGGAGAKPVASAATASGAGGAGIALGVAGGLLVLLGGGAYLVNRRWPLPELMRRRTRP